MVDMPQKGYKKRDVCASGTCLIKNDFFAR
jgi:hypothetical protein